MVNHIIEQLSKDEISVLCGAGISYNSGIPIVQKIYESLFLRLFHENDAKKMLNLLTSNPVPFERIIESILNYSNDDGLLRIFEKGEPNINHIIISQLFKRGNINSIFTTNFDCLLETQLRKINYIKDKDYRLYFNETNFKKIKFDELNEKKLIKLHGSIDRQNSVRITLRKITSKALTNSRRIPIEYLLNYGRHKNVLILGYSFSDDFDINVFIDDQKEITKNIIIIEHSNINQPIVELIQVKESKNPFKNKNCQGFRVYIDTTHFLKLLYKSIETEKSDEIMTNKVSKQTFDWEDLLDNWIYKFSEAKINYIAGALWNSLTQFNLGYKYLQISLNKINKNQELEIYYQTLTQKLLSLQRQSKNNNELEKHKDFCEQIILEIQEKELLFPKDIYQKLLSELYYRLGRIVEEQRNYKMALKYYYSVYKLDARRKDKLEMGITLHQIGILYRFLDADDDNKSYKRIALKCFRKSLAIKKRYGYIGGIARSYIEIGNVYLQNVNGKVYNQNMALKYFNKAESLLISGELDLLGFLCNQKSMILFENEKYEESKELCLKRIELLEDNKYTKTYASSCYYLARNEIRLNNYDNAIHYLIHAKEINLGFKEYRRVFNNNLELALAYLLLGDIEKSKEYFDENSKYFYLEKNINKAYYYLYLALYYGICKKKDMQNSCLNESLVFFKYINNSKEYYKLLIIYRDKLC